MARTTAAKTSTTDKKRPARSAKREAQPQTTARDGQGDGTEELATAVGELAVATSRIPSSRSAPVSALGVGLLLEVCDPLFLSLVGVFGDAARAILNSFQLAHGHAGSGALDLASRGHQLGKAWVVMDSV